MIVAARINHNWDDRKAQHVAELFDSVKTRVEQVQLESIHFVSSLLSATHKKYGDKIKKFLQTGVEADLDDLKLNNLKTYQESIELLLSLTGQGAKNKKVSGEVVHKHVNAPPGEPGKLDEIRPEAAAQLLQLLGDAATAKKAAK